MIRLTHLHTYAGPSIYAAEQAIVVNLSMDAADAHAAAEKFRLISRRFPRWDMEGIVGNDLDAQGIGLRLVSLARWLLNDQRGYIHVADCLMNNADAMLVLGYHKRSVSILALRLSASIFEHIEKASLASLNKRVNEFSDLCRQWHPDYQARILMQAADRQDVPYLPLVKGSKLWQYGWGSKARLFMESLSDHDSEIGAMVARNKAHSKAFFASLGIPTAKGALLSSADDLGEAVRSVGFPCVVKPLDRGGGKGVTTNILTDAQLAEAFATARSYSDGPILIEQFIEGDDHRLMVVDGKFIGAFRREPSSVTGDGVSNIRQLIKALNAARSKSLERSNYLRLVHFDAVLNSHLAAQGLALDTVLPAGQRITLRGNSNLSTGGVATDVSMAIHPMLKSMTEQMAKSVRLDVAGFDYITTDPSQSPWDSGGVFLEMDTTPGIDAPIAAGWAAEKIGQLVLGKSASRIPVHLHLLPKARVGEALADTAHDSSPTHATVAGSEIRIGSAILRVTDTAPWGAVEAALRNRSVDALRIACSVEDIIENGLPVDRFTQLTLTDVSVPAPWMALLQRCCTENGGGA